MVDQWTRFASSGVLTYDILVQPPKHAIVKHTILNTELCKNTRTLGCSVW